MDSLAALCTSKQKEIILNMGMAPLAGTEEDSFLERRLIWSVFAQRFTL